MVFDALTSHVKFYLLLVVLKGSLCKIQGLIGAALGLSICSHFVEVPSFLMHSGHQMCNTTGVVLTRGATEDRSHPRSVSTLLRCLCQILAAVFVVHQKN